MSIEELIQTEIYEKAEAQRKKDQELLNKELNPDNDDPMLEAFKRKLDKSGFLLGPKASKIAVDDAIKQHAIQEAKKKKGTYMGQENIHFVMMEYFLFGMSEANLMIEQLATLEKIQTKWSLTIDQLDALMGLEETKRQNATGE